MTLDELNTALRMEIINYRTTSTLTPDLRRLLMEMIWNESGRERYAKAMENENLKILCESEAYVACCKFVGLCPLERCKNIRAYAGQIIGSSFAGTFVKHGNFPSTITKITFSK